MRRLTLEGVTWYVRAVLNRLWQLGEGLGSVKLVERAMESLLDDRADIYHDLLLFQNVGTQLMLLALAREGAVQAPTAGEFTVRHGLTAASSASFALNDLRSHDLVCETGRRWIVYDRLFGERLSRFP